MILWLILVNLSTGKRIIISDTRGKIKSNTISAKKLVQRILKPYVKFEMIYAMICQHANFETEKSDNFISIWCSVIKVWKSWNINDIFLLRYAYTRSR